jgi:hypothetical protein
MQDIYTSILIPAGPRFLKINYRDIDFYSLEHTVLSLALVSNSNVNILYKHHYMRKLNSRIQFLINKHIHEFMKANLTEPILWINDDQSVTDSDG